MTRRHTAVPVTPKSSTVPRSRASITNLQSQQRRVLLATVNIAVVPGARALGTGEAHFDRQRGVVVDYDDFGRVAVIEARDRGTVDDFGVTGTAVCLRVIEHDVDGQPKRAGVL